MKARARDFRMRERQQSFTGGGPYVNVSDVESEQVLGIMPHVTTVIEVAQDSDAKLDDTAPRDNDDERWQRKRFRANISGKQ
ncbi:hypothetical protein EVAR_80296_1 [Eumeta japonica]|uniref:Uncharacterized protein n=1 Tax=Eumeta variegata TaxID=151549 RepID=A0A4C1UBG6_EUMVA|nr:hypothetical protein EVAR_80296_1 [Eumeta japonica]